MTLEIPMICCYIDLAPGKDAIEKEQEGNKMSAIQIDNGYLIINADADRTDGAYNISFDTEKEAEEAMNMLAEALCGRWQTISFEELLS